MRNPVTLFSGGPIDIGALTAPVDGPGGAGPDLRFDPTYKAIGEARRADNPRLPQGVWVRDVKRADWAAVERLCTDILRARSKDLQVACWLAEAVVQRTGFSGLAAGLRLLTALCRRFWPDLHPAIDDGDLAARLAPFEWLNARFPALLRNQPVVRSATNPEQAYTWTDYINAQLLEGLRQRDPKSVERSEAAGSVNLAAFTAAREHTDTRFWQDNNASLQSATTALAELNGLLGELCGAAAPGLGAIGDAIKDVNDLTTVALSERRPKPFAMLRRPTARPTAPPQAPAAAGRSDDAAPSREDLYAQLDAIADLLERQEPQSPVPSLIRCAVSWGNISFADLVLTFSDAGLDLGKVFMVLGINRIADASEPREATIHDG